MCMMVGHKKRLKIIGTTFISAKSATNSAEMHSKLDACVLMNLNLLSHDALSRDVLSQFTILHMRIIQFLVALLIFSLK